MKYVLEVNQHNIRPHLDIERDIQCKKNGLFTFTLRVNAGNIEDYAQFETITIRDYDGVLFTGIKERGFTYDNRIGSTENAVRPGNR